MNWQVKQLEREVTSWPGVTAHSHRFAGREFRVGDAEIGHVHVGGVVDIPFTRAMRDALLAQGWADQGKEAAKITGTVQLADGEEPEQPVKDKLL